MQLRSEVKPSGRILTQLHISHTKLCCKLHNFTRVAASEVSHTSLQSLASVALFISNSQDFDD